MEFGRVLVLIAQQKNRICILLLTLIPPEALFRYINNPTGHEKYFLFSEIFSLIY